jgi:hypothetical protein
VEDEQVRLAVAVPDRVDRPPDLDDLQAVGRGERELGERVPWANLVVRSVASAA